MSVAPYPTYKDSGVEWIGAVPKHWSVRPMRRVADLITDRADGPSFPVALENLESWTGRFIETETQYEGDGTAFQLGDILFGKLRPYLAKAWLADRAGEAVGDFHVLRCVGGNRPEFLQQVILTREAISLIDGSTFGAKMPRASWEFVGALPVPAPPTDEQEAIVVFLALEVPKIDALVAEQESLMILLKEKRQAVIFQAVTKGLDPNALTNDSRVTWLGELPQTWSFRKLRHLARLESGHTPSRQHPEYWVEEECVIPWFTLADVSVLRDERTIRVSSTTHQISELGMANSAARLLPTDTVFLSRTASVGFSGIMDVPMAVSQDFAAWICGQKLRPSYLLYYLRAMKGEFRRLMMGSTHQTIYMPDIEAFRVPVPSTEEQDDIIAFIEAATRAIDDLAKEAERAIALLRERRAALISAAVTGKIDVRKLGTTVQEAA